MQRSQDFGWKANRNVQMLPKGLGSYSPNARAAVGERGSETQPNLP